MQEIEKPCGNKMQEIEKPCTSYNENTVCQDTFQYCALAGAALACSGLKDCGIIVHGSPGCGWVCRWMRSDHAIVNYVPVISDVILEDDIIFGGIKKLDESVGWGLKSWKPKVLYILQACSGSLISDPIESVIAKYEFESDIPIINIDSGGYRGLAATGVDMVFTETLKRFARDVENPDDKSVNLIAPFLMGSSDWVFDLDEIKRLLTEMGLKINCVLTQNTSLEDIVKFNHAKRNLYLTYENLPDFNDYEDAHDIKRIGFDIPLPIGIANTEEWYFAVAEEFGLRKKAEEVLKRERKGLRNLNFWYNATWVMNWVSNKRVVVAGPAPWAASFANFLYYDLATFPEIIVLYDETENSIERAKGILTELKKDFEPIILENPLYIQVLEAIRSRPIEFAVGRNQEKMLFEGEGIAHLSLAGMQTILGHFNFIPYPSMGYKGILYLLSMLGRVVEGAFHEPQKWKDLKFKWT
ncbi:MAG: nitrogenase component 1 [Thermodesulfobacteriota bacterium]|nr:nitrogenase component 1 [Thermodesulfobacteriota bacterium]